MKTPVHPDDMGDDMGGVATTGSPADFGKLIVTETGTWAKVLNFSGAKAK